jgi:small subunit ribosomal protein S5
MINRRNTPYSGRRGPPRGQSGPSYEEETPEFYEKVVFINRCAKVVKGGRRFSFSALVVVGDREGRVGVGYGKAKEVPEAIRKGSERAHKGMVKVELKGDTIPHRVLGEKDGGKVLLRPASPGTGVIAGGAVRPVLEAAGIKDVLSKSLRSNNHGAVANATLKALKQLRTAETIWKIRKAK